MRPLVVAAALLLAAGPAAAAGRGFAIASFGVTLQINPDASLVVREQIAFEFRGAHQGIVRTIPRSWTRGGVEVPVHFEGLGAYDDAGQPLRAEVSYPGGYVRIKAWVPGAADTTKSVTLVYRVRRGVLGYDDHDEIYWNATGDEWEAPIRHAEVYVNVPPGVPPGEVRTLAFTGPRGGAGQDYTVEHVEGFLRFSTTRAFRPREGLTVVVGWPHGHVPGPSALRRAWWVLADYWPFGLPLAALLWGGIVWWAFGRDPGARRTVKPEYAPPEGLIPAEAGALVDERAEPRDVIATLVDLAVRGYLKIEPVPATFGQSDFLFTRLKPVVGDPDLKPFELVVLARVFGGDWLLNARQLSEVRRDYENVFPPLRDQLYRTMVEDGLFPSSPALVRRGWMLAGLLFAASAFFVADWWPWLGRYGLILPAAIILCGLVFVGWSRYMPKKTWAGAQTFVQVRGFQEFLERAEKDRLERLPPDTLHRWLPWAIALGVTERWIFNFQGLKVAAPSWYTGPGDFTLANYAGALAVFSRDTEAAILTT
ncbi:MAG: DUF2207 domain-containing protein, partial [Candidatus Rokubacteria bacterium]|nr:DUF2207 domain-containing protein [Candidatus Rokubacteria bacterium]